jgi:hypothetical protein
MSERRYSEAKEKELETRARLGPRLPRSPRAPLLHDAPAEGLRLPAFRRRNRPIPDEHSRGGPK